MADATARKCTPSLTFNGTNVTTTLASYLESVSYSDVASGDSDSLDVELQNIDLKWLGSWYPAKGDKIKGSLTFKDWETSGKNLTLSCGTFILDEVHFTGGPLKLSLGALAIPAKESFKSTERTKTWSKVTIKQIAQKIAARYSLSLSYSGSSITITSLEQSEKTDSAFLYELCKSYGLSMKVYNSKIVIYDQTTREKTSAVATLTRASFIDDAWDYVDALEGTYTGARISYKSASDDSEISVYLGLQKETASGSRVLKINETADSQSDAYYKAAAQVNLSNQEATTLSGTIWPNPKICAGVTVKITGMGKMNGKYFIDKSVTKVTASGTEQTIEAHKCQTRLTYSPKSTSSSSSSSTSSSSKTYKKGDIVTFNGGTHYYSSYAGAKGYSARAGKAKITLINSSGAHPYHLIHTDSTSNVYGWVDEGTFS